MLYPFSLIYGAITGIRNFLYNTGVLKAREFNIPIICVGNITVGGTGKTPHSEYIINLLKEKYRTAFLSRGYKRESKGFRIAVPGDDARMLGDEPCQVYRKHPEIIVAVCKNRVKGVEEILRLKPETEIIILDDGFQHRRLKPGLSILLTDFNRLMIYDHLLPYGELRESIQNMYRAEIILVTKSTWTVSPMQRRIIVKDFNKAAYQNLYFTTYSYNGIFPVFPGHVSTKGQQALYSSQKPEIILVTGISSPGPVADHLGKLFDVNRHFIFPDHHKFREKDLRDIITAFDAIDRNDKAIITTEKDAVRLQEFINFEDLPLSSFYYIPIGIHFLNEDREEFDNLVLNYVGKNIRNSRFSKSKRL